MVTEADTQFQHSGRANVHCNTRSMAPEVSVVRHAEVFVVVFGGVGELQEKHQEALWMSWKLWKSLGRSAWERPHAVRVESKVKRMQRRFMVFVLWIPGTHVTSRMVQ